MASNDGRFIAHLHSSRALLDLVDDEWRADHLGHDDFDLPTTDFDSDTDEARAVPKRNDEEKWGELCLDEFLHPTRRGQQQARVA
mmetsp:Transcript_33596/g.66878  ORF Transcript_33596/g.66878 Transcript_33596/m.66878 type:complete len:85 (+) Transcript_33596:69-323(+)